MSEAAPTDPRTPTRLTITGADGDEISFDYADNPQSAAIVDFADGVACIRVADVDAVVKFLQDAKTAKLVEMALVAAGVAPLEEMCGAYVEWTDGRRVCELIERHYGRHKNGTLRWWGDDRERNSPHDDH